MAATAPSTTSCAHSRSPCGVTASQADGHGKGGDAEQYTGQHGVGFARGRCDLCAGERDVGRRTVFDR